MTSVTEELRLAADFAPSTFEDWRRLVDGVLKGAPFEKLVSETYDGLKIDPIYPRARGAAAVAGGRRGPALRASLRRGPQVVAFAHPSEGRAYSSD